ncbi:glycoside hydrolase family 3 N-terminal domain-containing protein [Arthrobacter sp. ISL-69]|uniref:glycoside hydrolase family 3 N-terminal domain-containing protein n=1 Tax=Arthrobacter sp. ISL-69 TaxID=2819113 RepID=UPI001BE966A3|nr:glycoside hydrolase family 3 N-terminal domain-containing protein [Arthrobacter sp. ISL-69]MBT2538988.1 hypothetical protein [Arthrobacter sp. ISL-69]
MNAQVDSRQLRERYLLAFEKAIVESRAWLAMSAYNSISGANASESELPEMNSESGIDGVGVSDWTAVRSVNRSRE